MSRHRPLHERREQLVSAALTLGLREGAAAVTIRAVAQEANVALGMVHYCFDDKDELLVEMARSIRRSWCESVTSIINAGRLAGLDWTELGLAISRAMVVGLRLGQAKRLLLLELLCPAARTGQLLEPVQAHLALSTTLAHELLQNLAAATQMRFTIDPWIAARSVRAAIDGIELAWYVNHDDDMAVEGFRMLSLMLLPFVAPAVACGNAPANPTQSVCAKTAIERAGLNLVSAGTV